MAAKEDEGKAKVPEEEYFQQQKRKHAKRRRNDIGRQEMRWNQKVPPNKDTKIAVNNKFGALGEKGTMTYMADVNKEEAKVSNKKIIGKEQNTHEETQSQNNNKKKYSRETTPQSGSKTLTKGGDIQEES